MRKPLLIGGWLLVTLLVAGTFIVLNRQQTQAQAAPAAETQTLPRLAAAPGIEAQARVVPAQIVALRFPSKGIGEGLLIQEVLVQEGAAVKKGDPLAQLDTRDLQLRVENAQALLAQAQAEHEQLQADTNATRLQVDAEIATVQAEADAAKLRATAEASKLRADAAQARAEGRAAVAATLESSAQSVLQAAALLEANAKANQEKRTAAAAAADTARTAALSAAQAKVQQAEAALKREQLALDLAALRSPIDGTVIDVAIKVGELPSATETAITVADVSTWQIEATNVPDLSLVQIHEGTPARITFDALPDLAISGKVSRIKTTAATTAGSTGNTYTLIITPDQQDERVRWNMVASVAIQTQ